MNTAVIKDVKDPINDYLIDLEADVSENIDNMIQKGIITRIGDSSFKYKGLVCVGMQSLKNIVYEEMVTYELETRDFEINS